MWLFVAPITSHFVLWQFMCFSCSGKESEGSHDVGVQPVFALASSRFHMPLWHKGFMAQVKASLSDEPRTKNNFEGVATRAI